MNVQLRFRTLLSPLLVVLLLASLSATAQIKPGVRFGYSNYINTGMHTLHFGAQADYPLGSFLGLRLSAEMGIGGGGQSEHTVSGLNNNLDLLAITGTGSSSITAYQVALDQRIWVMKDGYENGGLYGILGLGGTLAKVKTKYKITSDLSQVVYIDGFPANGDEIDYNQYLIRGAVGYLLPVGKLNLMVEAKLNFPLNDAPSDEVIPVRQDLGIWFGLQF